MPCFWLVSSISRYSRGRADVSFTSIEDLKYVLVPQIKQPLVELFKLGGSMSEFTDKLFSLLYEISCDSQSLIPPQV